MSVELGSKAHVCTAAYEADLLIYHLLERLTPRDALKSCEDAT